MLTQNGHDDLSLFWFVDIQNKAGLRPGTDLINLGTCTTVRKLFCQTFEKLFVAYNLGLGIAVGYKCILLIYSRFRVGTCIVIRYVCKTSWL